jgi:hypothetical protein
LQPASRWFPGWLFNLENGGNMFLRNISWLSTNYTALYPRRQKSSISVETQSNCDAKWDVQLVHVQNVTSLPKGYGCLVTIHDKEIVNTDCCFNFNGTKLTYGLRKTENFLH